MCDPRLEPGQTEKTEKADISLTRREICQNAAASDTLVPFQNVMAGGNMTPWYPYYLLPLDTLLRAKIYTLLQQWRCQQKFAEHKIWRRNLLLLAPCLKRLSKLSQLRFFKYASRHFPNYTRTTAKFLLTSSQQWACRADPQLDRVMTVCSARHNAGQWLVDHGGIMGFILEIVDVITHCNYFYCS